MKKMTLFVLLFISFSTLAQHTVGSGGDYIRQLHVDAKSELVMKTKYLVDLKKKNILKMPSWTQEELQLLLIDFAKTPILWVTNAMPTCFYTAAIPHSPAYLSYQACKIKNLNEAQQNLIEISLIHQNILSTNKSTEIKSALLD